MQNSKDELIRTWFEGLLAARRVDSGAGAGAVGHSTQRYRALHRKGAPHVWARNTLRLSSLEVGGKTLRHADTEVTAWQRATDQSD